MAVSFHIEDKSNKNTVRVTDEYGCTATDQVNVNVYEPLQIDLEPTYYLNGVETITISPTILKIVFIRLKKDTYFY